MQSLSRRVLPRRGLLSVSRRFLGTWKQPFAPSRVEISTEAIANNVKILRSHIGPNVELMAVVKANGYGHGSVTVAKTALANGATLLGVANMAEAMDLREGGLTETPLLVFGFSPISSVEQAIKNNISLIAYDSQLAKDYQQAALQAQGKLKIHLKVDTGMGRIGALLDDAPALFAQLSGMPNLQVEGIMTHFSVADEDLEYTSLQVQRLRTLVDTIGRKNFKYVHASNSAGILGNRENYLDFVRCGLIMYGLRTGPSNPVMDQLKPAMSWKTVISQVKVFKEENSPIGYGQTYHTRSNQRIGVLPVGYADGFSRVPSWREVLVNGQRVPVVGRISMEKTTVDLSKVPNAKIGDEVVLLGKQGDAQITAEEIADWLGTINYEVVTSILPRVPRS